MLIINADDFGSEEAATNNIILCHNNKRITSTTAMVFMADSNRAASLAMETSIEVGLHLNFTQLFNGTVKGRHLEEYHNRIVNFLNRGKYHFILFNPALRRQFEYVYKAQHEEFINLYNREPTHIDGHHHMHLCTNMLLQGIIPRGTRLRTTFSFKKTEKSFSNRLYRRMLSKWISKRYATTDFMYSIEPIIRAQNQRVQRLKQIAELAEASSVEISVHPKRQVECDYLMSDEFLQIFSKVGKISYASL